MKVEKMTRKVELKALLSGAVALAPLMWAVAPTVAAAQQQPVTAVADDNEILVTAQRREQSIVDVPAAVTAIGGDAIQKLNLTDMPNVASQVPNFTVQYERGPNTTPSFNIRGVGSDNLTGRLNESSVGIYTDDVYLGDENMLNGGLFDIQRVEILRGPQGTLFGRNTTAGLVHFVSNAPTRELSGHASALYGANNAVTLEGAISGGIGEKVRVRLAGKWDRNDGHWHNTYLGAGQNGVPEKLGARNIWGLRGTIDIDFGPRTMLRVIGSFSENHSETTPVNLLGALKPGTAPGDEAYTREEQCTSTQILSGACFSHVQLTDPAALQVPREKPAGGITSFTSEDLRVDGQGKSITARLTSEFDWATFTSITNYSKNRFYQGIEAGYLTISVGQDERRLQPRSNEARQFSQELRLNGSTDAFDWVVGGLYYQDRKNSNIILNIDGNSLTSTTTGVKSYSHALFGQVDSHISDQVTLSIGARYTGDKRTLTEAVTVSPFLGVTQDVRAYMIAQGLPVETDKRDVTGKFGVSWEPSDDATYYLSLSRGMKGPGFNNGFSPFSSPARNAAVAGPVASEVIDSIEIGAKNRFLDRRVGLNLAAFYYKYQDKQVVFGTFDPASGGILQNYISVGDADVWGAEAELFFRPDEHWDFTFAGGLTDNKIVRSDVIVADREARPIPLEGKRLVNTPEYTFNAILGYHLPVADAGVFTLQTEVNGRSKVITSLVNDPLGKIPSRILTNLRVLWESPTGRHTAQVFVTNVFNIKHENFLIDTVANTLGALVIQEGEGRLWGVKFGTRF
jgi:iron complex outermembrane receptor protein